MRADFPVVLDACVLANIRVCDLLLRLAETPRMYLPYWSEVILDETQRAHVKFGWDPKISESWRTNATTHFPDASMDCLDCALCPKEVDEGDHHVVQAALRARAEVIVTFNLKHFPSEHLNPIGLYAQHPAEFLLTLFSIEPLLVARRINEIAKVKKEPVEDVLTKLARYVPAFVDQFADSAGIVIED